MKLWYDGFTFGEVSDIYNPWSITMFLDEGKLAAYWANTSGNGLAGKLIREGNTDIKSEFENLLNGECIEAVIDEQIVFSQLDENDSAVWSLLLASGYLKVESIRLEIPGDVSVYRLKLTNYEVKIADRKYDTDLIQRGFPVERIYRYGFAFEGEKCLIRKA